MKLTHVNLNLQFITYFNLIFGFLTSLWEKHFLITVLASPIAWCLVALAV